MLIAQGGWAQERKLGKEEPLEYQAQGTRPQGATMLGNGVGVEAPRVKSLT